MIRNAKKEDAEELTQLSFESKKVWGYPKHYFDIWRNELTITPEYINRHQVFIIEDEGRIIGYYALVCLKRSVDLSGIKLAAGWWLEHMFVSPEMMGKGVGKTMFQHMKTHCCELFIQKIMILSDPHAKGFYLKMGCEYIAEYPSMIKNRTTPYLTLSLKM